MPEIRNGVIREPAPTPVSPTRNPTQKPPPIMRGQEAEMSTITDRALTLVRPRRRRTVFCYIGKSWQESGSNARTLKLALAPWS